MKTVTGAYRRLLGALVMLIAIGIQLSGGVRIPAVGSRPVATADWQGIEDRSLPGVVDGGSVVSHLSSRDRSRPYSGEDLLLSYLAANSQACAFDMGEWLSDSTGHSVTDREIGDGEIRLIELDLPRVTIKAGELRKLIDCLIERDYTEQPLYVYMTKPYKDAYVAYPLSVFYPMPHGIESDAIGYFYGNGIYFIMDKSVRNQVKTGKKECCHFEIYGFQTDMVFNYDPPMWEVKDIKSNPDRCRLFIDSSGMENNKAEIKSPL